MRVPDLFVAYGPGRAWSTPSAGQRRNLARTQRALETTPRGNARKPFRHCRSANQGAYSRGAAGRLPGWGSPVSRNACIDICGLPSSVGQTGRT